MPPSLLIVQYGQSEQLNHTVLQNRNENQMVTRHLVCRALCVTRNTILRQNMHPGEALGGLRMEELDHNLTLLPG